MAWRLFPARKTKWRLGLQFLPYAMRLVEVRVGSAIRVRRHATVPIEHGMIQNHRLHNLEWVSFELEKIVRDWRCKGREVVLSVPLPIVVMRRTPIPLVPDKEIRDLLEVEMENTLHLPFADPVFDYVKLAPEQLSPGEAAAAQETGETPREQLHVLVVAAPRDAVEGYVDAARLAGLKPVAVDIEPLALYRALEGELPTVKGPGVLLLHITLTGVDAAIFSGGIPEFMRYIPLPVPFHDETRPQESIGLSRQGVTLLEQQGQFSGYANDLFAEVNRIMSFYQYSMNEGRKKIEQICVSGEFGDIGKVALYLQERLSVPVHVCGHERVTAMEQGFSPLPFSVAVGLGMKDVNQP